MDELIKAYIIYGIISVLIALAAFSCSRADGVTVTKAEIVQDVRKG